MNKNLNSIVRFLLGNEKENLKNIGLLIFRLAIGFLMLSHGWQKLSNFETLKLSFPDPLGIGSQISLLMMIFAEFGCSILIILGLFTRLATLPLMFGMAVAIFVIHKADPFSVKELAVLYFCMYVALFFTGPGKYSLDRFLYTRWDRRYPTDK